MSEPQSPLDVALDVLVYAPVGLALTLSEELPRLALKGRSRVESQAAAARMIGRMAVGQGLKLMGGPPGEHPAPTPTSTRETRDRAGRAPAEGAAGTPSSPGSSEAVPEAASLAIPGYDSLSASQVVQRLAGLRAEELRAVGRYEAARRGRRTILSRVAQLQER